MSAVILAAGKSSRMGRDKAWLEFHGQPLLARQIALAREIGAGEVFISGRANVDYSALGCPVLHDPLPDQGPLAGIAAAMAAAQGPLLLVLAVDMPYLAAAFLRRLLARCAEAAGAVPQRGDVVEPLAAFYPKAAGELLGSLLGRNSGPPAGAKHFAEHCVHAGLAQYVPVSPAEAAQFQSWNLPADVVGRG